METLPDRQAALLDFLRRYQREQGMAPSITDICRHFGYRSPRAAAELLEKLEARGAIRREPGLRRSIRVLWPEAGSAGLPGRAAYRIPLMGRIAAGAPITAGIDAATEFIDLDPALFDTPPNLLWRVEGSSMVNAGIHDGDLVGASFRSEFRNRQIVAAVVLDEKTDDPKLTLKRYEKKGPIITLYSENDDQESYRPLVFDTRQDAIEIIGIFSGLIRTRGAE